MSALTSRRKQSIVPPGFRFHPTEEEIVGYYLFKKVSGERMDVDVIEEIDLYNFEPWDLEEKCRNREENDMYFFSHMNKKYPTGTRKNRATTSGFWKATGKHKFIHTKNSVTGMRKTLVFYRGRAPNGQKTEWIMHEFRLKDVNINTIGDAWGVCRFFTQHRKKKRVVNGDTAFICHEEEMRVTMSPSDPDSPTQFLLQNRIYNEYPLTCEQRQINFNPHNEQEHLFLKSPELESLIQGNYKQASASENSARSSLGNHMKEQNINEYTIEFQLNNVYDYPDETYIHQQSILHEDVETSEWKMVAVGKLTHEEAIKEHRSLAYNANSCTEHESPGDTSLSNLLNMMEQNLSDVLSSRE